MILKKMAHGFICVMMILTVNIAVAAPKDASNPYQITEVTASEIFTTINSKSAEIKQNPDLLKGIVKSDLLPYVHVKYAAALALGEYYKQLTPTQRNAYFEAFEGYLVQAFAQALSLYDGQTYRVAPEQDLSGKNIVSVRVSLINKDSNQQPIRIDFQWRKNTATGQWQAYDLIAEGISMLTTKQNEWATLLRQQGVDALIKQLRQDAAQKVDPNASVTSTN